MLHPTQLLFLAAAFLVPGSQAVVSNTVASNTVTADMNTAGYFCSIRQEVRTIHIHYGESAQGLPCEVNYRKGQQLTQLLKADRNTDICEAKAKVMAARLTDRGWHCRASGINL